MKKIFTLSFFLTLMLMPFCFFGQQWVRVNQLGYMPQSVKVAVFISTDDTDAGDFTVCDAATGKVVYSGKAERAANAAKWGMKSAPGKVSGKDVWRKSVR